MVPGHLISRGVSARSLNPIISHNSGRKRLSTVLFGEQSPVVITGSSGKSQLPRVAHSSHICAPATCPRVADRLVLRYA